MDTANNFGLAELYAKLNRFDCSHFYSPKTNTTTYHIVVIESGSVTTSQLSTSISACGGCATFIPMGIQYVSKWVGRPEIRNYDIMFSFSADFLADCGLQAVSGLPAEVVGLADSIYKSFSENRPFQAYSDFYRLFGIVYPQLKNTGAHPVPALLHEAVEYMRERLCDSVKIGGIAEFCHVSESTLYHVFQKELHETPVSFLNSMRIAKAIELMKLDRDIKIAELCGQCGFNSEHHFRKTFTDTTKMTPSAYRKLL